MHVNEAIAGRRSNRFFDETGLVLEHEIEAIIESARWAPSARNLQPLEYIIVRDIEKRKKLAQICRQPQPQKAPASIIVTANKKIAGRVGEISPHDITTTEKGVERFIYMDAAAAIQNMLLTAHHLKIGSLWISSFDDQELVRLLNTPEHITPVAVVCLGKAAREPVTPPKKTLKETVHREEWSDRTLDDKTYLDFSRKINEIY